MRSILCPTDFSKSAANAIDYGASLAREFKCRLVLVHVYTPPATFNSMAMTVIEDATEELKKTAEKRLGVIEGSVRKKYGIDNIEVHVISGLPGDTIDEVARDRGADLIVMGATGTTRMERMMMGSVTSKVIRIASCPVLSIPATSRYEKIEKILFATDLQEDNMAAALNIVKFAKHFEAEISFVLVDDQQVVHSEKDVAAMTKKIRGKIRYTNLSGYIVSGSNITKALEIFVKKHKAQMLVMMTHERHFLSQSLTRIISHQSSIPLLALKHTHKSL